RAGRAGGTARCRGEAGDQPRPAADARAAAPVHGPQVGPAPDAPRVTQQETSTAALRSAIRAAIRDIPDYPKAGVSFKDITPLLGDGALYGAACELLATPFRGQGITHVLSVESRGFLFGGPVAVALGAGLVPVRKP